MTRAAKIWRGALGLFIVLAIAAFFFGPSAFRGLKAWRATALSEQARTALQTGDFQGAMNRARSALALAPDLLAGKRAVAEILTAARDGGAVGAWAQVIASPQVTLDDRRAAAECAVNFGAAVPAAQWIAPLLEKEPGDARNLLLAAKSASLENQRAPALDYAQKAVAADPQNLRAALFLATVRLIDPATRDDAARALLALSARDEAEGLAALETLARVPLTPPQAEQVIARLRAHPRSGSSQKLLALALEVRLHPPEREALLDAAGAEYQKGDPKALRDFCGWLNANEGAARVLTLVPLSQARTRKDFFLVWLDAQAALRHWSEIRDVLSKKPLPLEDVYVELYLARCADELKQDTESDLHWRLAQLAAQGSPEQALYLANYAEKQGRTDRAQASYLTIAENPIMARPAYEGLLRLAQTKDTATIAQVLAKMHARWPTDSAIANDDAYYQLLLKRNVPENRATAEKLVAAEPASLPHRTVLALACLRARDFAAAAAVYDNLKINWANVPPSALAIYAATLQAQNRDEMAATISRGVKAESLRPEERLLLYGVN